MASDFRANLRVVDRLWFNRPPGVASGGFYVRLSTGVVGPTFGLFVTNLSTCHGWPVRTEEESRSILVVISDFLNWQHSTISCSRI
jgi:hypothetical protein